MTALVNMDNLCVRFDENRRIFASRRSESLAVDHVTLDVQRGEVIGVVGESGAGKSTLGLAVVRQHSLESGRIVFDGMDVTALDRLSLKRYRRDVQMIFQDPYGSLPPGQTLADIVTEPLVIHGVLSGRRNATTERRRRAGELLEEVGLPTQMCGQVAEQLSGGQRQRVAIARAMALRPRLVVADEPTSALDVSVQAQILELLRLLQRSHGLTMMLISHNLGVVRSATNRVAVMYAGRLIELARTSQLFDNPLHPYTRSLLQSVPVPNPTLETQRRRARRATQNAAVELKPWERSGGGPPALTEVEPGHFVEHLDGP